MGTIDLDTIDIEKLRLDLKKYFESGQIYKNPFSVSSVLSVEHTRDCDLVPIALENGFNLEEYKKQNTR